MGSMLQMNDPNKIYGSRHQSTLSGSRDSISSSASEESFINKVKGKWGDEESELRQAIYFQFIKTVTVINDCETGSIISDLDKSVEENNY